MNFRIIDIENIKDSIYDIKSYLDLGFSKETLKYLLDKEVDLNEVFSLFDKRNIWIDFNYITEDLIALNQEDVIIKNINYFMRNNPSILSFKKIIKDSKIDTKLVDDFINGNPYIIITEITDNNVDYLKEEKIYDFFKILIDELLKNENKKYSDIEYINEGGYSKVYGIGSKVFKIGEGRATFNIKNNKRYLKPLYRTIIKSSYKDFCIEITEKVDTSNITDEDVYFMYKELRDEGILWLDATRSNLGRLLRDNKIYFNGIDFVDKESTGYTTDSFEILPKGSLVLLDSDRLYEADKYFETRDYNLFLATTPYERRYKKEKSSNKIK